MLDIWASEERKRLLDVFVSANAMAENYYADGTGKGHPSIQGYYRARDEFTEWLMAQSRTDETKQGFSLWCRLGCYRAT